MSEQAIIAITKNGGIGKNGGMAWHCREELQLFKNKTMGKSLVMGRKTVENLPFLRGRKIYCLTKDKNLDTSRYKNKVTVINDFKEIPPDEHVFYAGGAEVYKELLKKKPQIDWHVSMMKKEYDCDTFFQLPEFDPFSYVLQKTEYASFTEYIYWADLNGPNFSDRPYLSLLKRVYETGKDKQGRNGTVRSLFSEKLKFDLGNGFPLLTTRRMFWRGIVEELLFFIRGQTDSKILEEKGINIWKGNTSREFLDRIGMPNRREGILGNMYGYQWRHFGAEYDEKTGKPLDDGVDQLQNVINKIKTDPQSRRIIMTTFNPAQVDQGVLYPCHGICTVFSVDDKFLDCSVTCRSGDMFLGIPFNIASYALLLSLIAKITGKTPRCLNLNIEDAHIYSEHFQAVEEQLKRPPYLFPDLYIQKQLETIQDLERLSFEDLEIKDYDYHPPIKVKMIS